MQFRQALLMHLPSALPRLSCVFVLCCIAVEGSEKVAVWQLCARVNEGFRSPATGNL